MEQETDPVVELYCVHCDAVVPSTSVRIVVFDSSSFENGVFRCGTTCYDCTVEHSQNSQCRNCGTQTTEPLCHFCREEEEEELGKMECEDACSEEEW
jgi:hypothetical protein